MIKSMTGFGRGEYADDKRNVVAEIRSVNHRYCDIHVKMPRRYVFAEDRIKNLIKEKARRGKIEVSVMVENIGDADVNIKLNTAVAKQYYDNLKQLSGELELDGEITLEYLSSFPDVMKAIPDVEDEEEAASAILAAVSQALDGFETMRMTEGAKLAEDLIHRGNLIRDYVDSIGQRAPKLQEIYAGRLVERIKELLGDNVQIPEERIAMEAAIFADKSNITEELVRLDSHMLQMKKIIESDSPEGKKLDFLVQEMNREANTIGSKANDLDITSIMLEIKSEVEKIREQVQNIE